MTHPPMDPSQVPTIARTTQCVEARFHDGRILRVMGAGPSWVAAISATVPDGRDAFFPLTEEACAALAGELMAFHGTYPWSLDDGKEAR